MKTLISIFAVTLALAFTGPAFAGAAAAKTEADCVKAGGTDLSPVFHPVMGRVLG